MFLRIYFNGLVSPRLSTSFKAKVKIADNFWSALPENICDDISIKDKNSDCWNGIGKGR